MENVDYDIDKVINFWADCNQKLKSARVGLQNMQIGKIWDEIVNYWVIALLHFV